MSLHPEMTSALTQMREAATRCTTDDAVAAAREYHELQALLGTPPELRDAVGSVEDVLVPGPKDEIQVRIYRPDLTPAAAVGVWMHGGGWISGSLETADVACRYLCQSLGATIVSVAYRTAPESVWPAPLEDCMAAARWTLHHLEHLGHNMAPTFVGGDSAGAHLAAMASLGLRNDPLTFAGQLLVYPAVDLEWGTTAYASRRELAGGYGLTAEAIAWSMQTVLSGARPECASPIRATDLRGLPAAVVMTAEFDPLRDEGRHYAARLREAGVPVWEHDGEGLIHGSMDFLGTSAAVRQEFMRVMASMRSLLDLSPPPAECGIARAVPRKGSWRPELSTT